MVLDPLMKVVRSHRIVPKSGFLLFCQDFCSGEHFREVDSVGGPGGRASPTPENLKNALF